MNTDSELRPKSVPQRGCIFVWRQLCESWTEEWQQPQYRKRLIAFYGVGTAGAVVFIFITWRLVHLAHKPALMALTNLGVAELLFFVAWPLICLRSYIATHPRFIVAWVGTTCWLALWYGLGLYSAHLSQPVSPVLMAMFCKGFPVASVFFLVILVLVCLRIPNSLPNRK